uniref:XapX domain-containing protein n=1 Tax=Halomonas sp. TaxID=1486246 RepID=UPI0034583F71
MKIYLVSLGAGLLVGLIYSLLNVRSPAPPIVALIGLLGMLGGEQIIPITKHLLGGTSLASAWGKSQCSEHMFGSLPGHGSGSGTASPPGEALVDGSHTESCSKGSTERKEEKS